jgi:thymidylate kinase
VLYLVEGLNCAGKTYWINKQVGGAYLHTPYLNPKNWDVDDLPSYISHSSHLDFLLGAYYAIIHIYQVGDFKREGVYWDRTWISAFVYGSLTKDCFKLVVAEYAKYANDLKIVYADTPVNVCLKRLNALRSEDTRYNNYELSAIEDDWIAVKNNFNDAFDIMRNNGFSEDKFITVSGE